MGRGMRFPQWHLLLGRPPTDSTFRNLFLMSLRTTPDVLLQLDEGVLVDLQ